MKLQIDLLKNHAHQIPRLIEIWHEGIAKICLPDIFINRVKDKLHDHLNTNFLSLTFIALDDDQPVGMCSLRKNDGNRPDLMPWLGSLVVDPAYQKHGLGKDLVDATKRKSHRVGF